MQALDAAQYDLWRQEAEVLEQDGHGVKVLRLADGTFLKLFRRKRWLSKKHLLPAGQALCDQCGQTGTAGHSLPPYSAVVSPEQALPFRGAL